MSSEHLFRLDRIRVGATNQEPQDVAAALHERFDGLEEAFEVRLVQHRLAVRKAFALEDSAQLCVLRVVDSHHGDAVSQVLVEARIHDTGIDLDVVSCRYQIHQSRLKLPSTVTLALFAEVSHMDILIIFFPGVALRGPLMQRRHQLMQLSPCRLSLIQRLPLIQLQA